MTGIHSLQPNPSDCTCFEGGSFANKRLQAAFSNNPGFALRTMIVQRLSSNLVCGHKRYQGVTMFKAIEHLTSASRRTIAPSLLLLLPLKGTRASFTLD
jgi:hypothetical protein